MIQVSKDKNEYVYIQMYIFILRLPKHEQVAQMFCPIYYIDLKIQYAILQQSVGLETDKDEEENDRASCDRRY